MADPGRATPTNLPAQLTSFVGRERELAEVKRLLLSHRLVTLSGAGGCGKTRLALRAAGELLEEFPDGVWFVDLAPLSNPAGVDRVVAGALGASEQPNRPLQDALAESLRHRRLLLILDNCEHVVYSCAVLADALLRGAPGLRILATSRESLGIAAEVKWTVPPLSLPDIRRLPTYAELMKCEAVRLFVDRAAAANSAFVFGERDAWAVARLCQQLDGIPLAIEMAATWVDVLTVQEILERLSERFQLLTSGHRVALPRHQTLKTAMDWSYELLSPPERVLLSRLSVFAGGGTLDAVETVCAGGDVERADVLRLLRQLVGKSLVLMETRGGAGRYRMLETIRQYGQTRLVNAAEASETQGRHRGWYLEFAERAQAELRGPAQAAWLERLESEHDNLRAALERSKAEGDGDAWLRLAAALHGFWFMRGHLSEGREWLEGALTVARDAPASTRAWALCGAGNLAWRQGDPKGETLLRESLTLFRGLGDSTGIAHVLHHVAHVLIGQGDYERASGLFEESVALFKDVGSTWGVGWSLYCLGDLMLKRGDDTRATVVLEESLALCRQAGNTWTTANVLGSLGMAAEKRGDYDTAGALLGEGVTIAQQIGAKFHAAWLQCTLARVTLAQGRRDQAFTLYRDSLLRRKEIGDMPGFADCLDGLAEVASEQRDHWKAARLLACAKALREQSGYKRSPRGAAEHGRRVASIQEALGPAAFAAAQAAGSAMTLEEAMECALASSESHQPKRSEADKSPAAKRAGLLAPREQEVAALIAEGKSNREIAAALSITESTAAAHVQHILNKLGVNSRAQIAAWAVAHGLAPSPESHSTTP